MMTRLLVVSLTVSFVMAPAIVWAERVWDSDLKRYLTEQELSMAEVYLTEEEALKLMFPKSDTDAGLLLRRRARSLDCRWICRCESITLQQTSTG